MQDKKWNAMQCDKKQSTKESDNKTIAILWGRDE